MLRPSRNALPLALLRARDNVAARFRPAFTAHGINEQQWRVLRVLAEVDQIDATELSSRAHILAPSLTRILQKLSVRGFVTRISDTTDRRRAILRATPLAHEFIARVSPDTEAVYAGIEALVGADQVAELVRRLNDLSDALPRGLSDEDAGE